MVGEGRHVTLHRPTKAVMEFCVCGEEEALVMSTTGGELSGIPKYTDRCCSLSRHGLTGA